MDLSNPEVRDAYYETEATIDQYIYHENTPPFVSKLLIQRFGISNPSPRYIATVATAFKSGFYKYSNGAITKSFGDNNFGNLAATAAAIILDREATSSVLNADPTYGNLKEPILKLLGFMKSMEYTDTQYSRIRYPILGNNIGKVIGQMAYEHPDVFSFFSPDFSPSVKFTNCGLFSPEAQAKTLKTTIGFSNGLFALIRHGLNRCSHGFGRTLVDSCFLLNDHTHIPAGFFKYSTGYLGYKGSHFSSTDEIIEELGTLITAGRLSKENKEIIVEAYDDVLKVEGRDSAFRVAQQLISLVPEFHSTNIVQRKKSEQSSTIYVSPPENEPYKAIIVVQLFGGMDSFYMLAPHYSCDSYVEYAEARGLHKIGAALHKTHMIPIDASSSDQNCTMFGLNKLLPIFKTIYDAGHGLFLANTGHLQKPIHKYNYKRETESDLFSHHAMLREGDLLDAFRKYPKTGLLGRMLDVFQKKGFGVGPMGIDTMSEALAGHPGLSRPIEIVSNTGADPFYSRSVSERVSKEKMINYANLLNGETELNSGFFADLWSRDLLNFINKTELLTELNQIQVKEPYLGKLGKKLGMVSKLIQAHEKRGVQRDTFYIELGGFDNHCEMKNTLDYIKFPDINEGIDSFYNDMKSLELLNNITFVLFSEFGRVSCFSMFIFSSLPNRYGVFR